ncbi:MAG: hypothetical protein ABJE95_00710 [Byssovorax sp.]
MKPSPHPDTFNSPLNRWRREIAAHAAQPLVAARIAKIGAPQGILAEACERANRAHIALAQLAMPFPEHHVDLKPTQALEVAKREILLATIFFEAAHAEEAPTIDVATCRADLVNMWHQVEAATTAPASTTPPSD